MPDLDAILTSLPDTRALLRLVEKTKPTSPLPEEVDVWWGGYSGWAMLPSWIVCLLATVVLYALSRALLDRDTAHLLFWTLGGALWLGQLTRFCYRLFGYDYRLTSYRLYVQRGSLYPGVQRVDLDRVKTVRLQRGMLGQLLGTGDVQLEVPNEPTVVVTGVFNPREVGRLIEATSKAALERKAK